MPTLTIEYHDENERLALEQVLSSELIGTISSSLSGLFADSQSIGLLPNSPIIPLSRNLRPYDPLSDERAVGVRARSGP